MNSLPLNQDRNTSPLVRVIGLAIMACLSFGCQREPPTDRLMVYPVRGTLYADGMPAAGAIVTLHREPPSADGRMPIGLVDQRGIFRIGYYDEQDGAPPGTYQVLVYWPRHGGSMAPDRLQQRYAMPKNPAATVVIEDRENQLPDIRIAGPPNS